jgi:IMP dehydrogenase/GMP reductase
MRTNANITIYNKYVDPETLSEKYQRHQIVAIAWESRKAVNVIRSGGYIEADRAALYIPFRRGEYYQGPIAWQALVDKSGFWTLQQGDFVVKGLVTDEISDTFTITDLSRKYDDVFTISSIDTMDQGSPHLHHWQVGLG